MSISTSTVKAINSTSMIKAKQLATLLQLSSPSLPIGGFSYSQGLEAAVELGLIHDEPSAQEWIMSQLCGSLTHCEAPIYILLYQAWQTQNLPQIQHWSQWFFASRETQEARLETQQMAQAMLRLLEQLQWGEVEQRQLLHEPNLLVYPTMHSFAMQSASIPQQDSLVAYLFSWLENQVMAAIKSVPLGQTAGQRILQVGIQELDRLIAEASQRAEQEPPALETLAPMYGIVSASHETLFSRLFRS